MLRPWAVPRELPEGLLPKVRSVALHFHMCINPASKPNLSKYACEWTVKVKDLYEWRNAENFVAAASVTDNARLTVRLPPGEEPEDCKERCPMHPKRTSCYLWIASTGRSVIRNGDHAALPARGGTRGLREGTAARRTLWLRSLCAVYWENACSAETLLRQTATRWARLAAVFLVYARFRFEVTFVCGRLLLRCRAVQQ